MKTIYILLTRSNTSVSRIIHAVTADNYTHASISFSTNLQPMYSFARKHIHTPLPAGLRIEPFDHGYLKKYPYIPCALYSIQVSDEAYIAAQHAVRHMMNNADDYRYNIIGLFLCRLNIPYRRKQRYFCSQFIGEVLENSDALRLPKDPSLMRPIDYSKMSEFTCLFEGRLNELTATL